MRSTCRALGGGVRAATTATTSSTSTRSRTSWCDATTRPPPRRSASARRARSTRAASKASDRRGAAVREAKDDVATSQRCERRACGRKVAQGERFARAAGPAATAAAATVAVGSGSSRQLATEAHARGSAWPRAPAATRRPSSARDAIKGDLESVGIADPRTRSPTRSRPTSSTAATLSRRRSSLWRTGGGSCCRRRTSTTRCGCATASRSTARRASRRVCRAQGAHDLFYLEDPELNLMDR